MTSTMQKKKDLVCCFGKKIKDKYDSEKDKFNWCFWEGNE